MLTLTENAGRAVRAIARANHLLPSAGLRITADPPEGEQEAQLHATVEETSRQTDVVIESQGIRIFLNATAARELAGKTIDAEVGEAGGVHFTVSNAN